MFAKAGFARLMTMPLTPSSRTSTFEPPPRSRTCSPSSRQRLTTDLQLVDRRRFGKKLRRAADLEPGAFRERNLLANAINSTHSCHQ